MADSNKPIVPGGDTVGTVGEIYLSENGKTYECVAVIDNSTVKPNGETIPKVEYVWACTDDGAGGGAFPFDVSDTDPVTISCTKEELIAAIDAGKTPIGYWHHTQSNGTVIRLFHLMKRFEKTVGTDLTFYFCDKTSSGSLVVQADGTVERSYQANDSSDVTIHFESVLQAPTLSHSYAEMVKMGVSELLKRTVIDVAGYNAYRPNSVFIGNDTDAGWCVQFSFLNWTASKNADETTRFPTSSVRTVYVTAEKAYLVDKSFYNCLTDA